MSVAVKAVVQNVKIFFCPMYICKIYADASTYDSGACDTKEEALQTAIHKIVRTYPKKKMSFLDKLQFSYNWNGKLDCQCFTTLRLRNPKYQIGNAFEIWLKDKYKGQAKIIDVKNLYIEQISDWIALLDTGYDAENCKELIRTMNKGIDWSKQQLAYVLLKRYEPNP